MKQGCNMSPNLSNVFQNDLHEVFDDMCDGVVLDGFRFNSLSWADDLVLVSTTPRGLQTCLNRLHDYCYKWAISINPSKTVCMIMSKGKCKNRPQFYINKQELSQTNKVTYLGLVITSNMNHSIMMEDRIQKANRATYLLRQAISCIIIYLIKIISIYPPLRESVNMHINSQDRRSVNKK